ncbi:MAG: TatD family hydrolase [Bacteroidales bacterium]
MQLIDTHTHLYLPEFDNDRDEAVKNAVASGVTHMMMPNIDIASVPAMMSAASRYPGICLPMIGLHPTSVKEDWKNQLDELVSLVPKNNFHAVGEIGIDLYWDKTFIKEQLEAFRIQIRLSLELKLPLVIHSRNAFPEIFSVLDEFKNEKLKGVFHAFSGDLPTAKKALSLGFRLGIGGIVTFKNSGLDKVVAETGPSDLILETDSPYLAPVPHRGKRNESAYICIVNRKLADIFNMEAYEIASITSKNSRELFNL